MANLPSKYVDRVKYEGNDYLIVAPYLRAANSPGGAVNYTDIESMAAVSHNIHNGGGTLRAADDTYRYRLLVQVDEGNLMPVSTDSGSTETSSKTINTRAFNPFGSIYYYNSNALVTASNYFYPSTLYSKHSALRLGYSFAKGRALTMTAYRSVYLKCTPQSDGKVKLDLDEPYTQTLPVTEDGFVYIYLGDAFVPTQLELQLNHPVYYYKNNALRLWTGPD